LLRTVETYLASKFDELNSRKAESVKVRLIENDLQLSQVSASQADIHYQIFITGVESNENIESDFSSLVNVRVDFLFNVANKDYSVYKLKFDEYLYPLYQLIKEDSASYGSTEITGFVIADTEAVAISNADQFQDSYYRPSLSFAFRVYDHSVSNRFYTNANSTV